LVILIFLSSPLCVVAVQIVIIFVDSDERLLNARSKSVLATTKVGAPIRGRPERRRCGAYCLRVTGSFFLILLKTKLKMTDRQFTTFERPGIHRLDIIKY